MFKRIRNALIGRLGGLLVAALGATLRYRIRDTAAVTRPSPRKDPVIFAFWHHDLLLMPCFARRFLTRRPCVCLVSASKDGEMIAHVLHRFGLDAERGSSSRKGREAYRSLAEALECGTDVAITPDGPRGPRHHAHAGAAGLAVLSGCALVPIRWRAAWKIELPTWDRFVIPLPLSRVEFDVGPALRFAPETSVEEAQQQMERALAPPPTRTP
ncbi:MAG: lysophospholipid acyltransferase family protein [Verrucomicrobiae bacterium]|nr:lysophospholipid acyltransferase family protein [Verrucomicrobiae bacterium]